MKLKQNFDVIVVGGAHINALGVIRSLGENGVKPILLLTGRKNGYIKKSKYVKKTYYCELDESKIVDILMKQVELDYDRCYIIPTGDYVAAAIDKNLKLLQKKYIVPNIDNNENKIVYYMDKFTQYNLACDYDVPTAKSILINLNKSGIKNDIYPCILKPVVSANGTKSDIRICQDITTFKDAIKEFKEKKYDEVLLQELLDYDYELDVPGYCTGKQARVDGIIKKINVYPAKRGSACYMTVGKPNVQIVEKLKKLFVDIKYNGIFDVDLFVKGDNIYLNEINFRNGAISYALTGSNIYIIIDWILSNENIKVKNHSIEKNYDFIVEDYNFRLVLSKNISIFKYIKEFVKAKKYAYLNIKDMKPVVYKLIYGIKKD